MAGAGCVASDSNRNTRASIAERWRALPAHEKVRWQKKADEVEERRRSVAAASFSDRRAVETSNLSPSQLKRLYARRLGSTVRELAEQDVWTRGLGLQNHHSPLRPELVSEELDVAGLAESFRETFGYDAEMQRNPVKLPTFCRSYLWAHGGICEKHPCFGRVAQLVHQFDSGLQSKRVATSLLIVNLQEEHTGQTQWFFQGCVCRRPLLHVLVRLWPRAPGRLAMSMKDGVPVLLTSHQMFLSCVCSYLSIFPDDATASQLRPQAAIYKSFSCSHEEGDLVLLAGEETHNIDLSSRCKREAVPKPKTMPSLPFGLSSRSYKWQKKAGPEASGHRVAEQPASSSSAGPVPRYDEFESDLPPGADVEFSQALKAEAAAFKDAEAAPASSSSAGDKPESREAVEQDSKPSSAGGVSAAASAAGAAGQNGVFFQRNLGVLDIGPSPRKGLMCMNCGGKIEKGELKFSFAYRLNKPPRSIHVACVAQIQKDLVQPCIDSLHRLLMNPKVQESELLKPACTQALGFLEG
ncbi:unnamed protein product [Symbiodinium sp. CCMP2456]|nr:unnamed protein product [Symbiodinium sp. CCMP2456]